MTITTCPSTLASGYDTFSPKAIKTLFNGLKVSHELDYKSPSASHDVADEFFKNAGRVSVSGVQPKLSMLIDSDCRLRYAKQNEQGTFIAKPYPTAYHIINRQDCPANENLTMQIASQAYGIETAANGLVFYIDGEPLYITRRFDLKPQSAEKYMLEDFASLMGYTRAHGGSDYKYCNGSYEECGDIIRDNVKSWLVDSTRFFKLVIFNFLTLNDDAHLKNFSLLKTDGEYHLSPAYDLINTSLHLSQPRIFALDKGLFREGMTLSDVKSVSRSDFEEFGRRLKLPKSVVAKILDSMSAPSATVKKLVDNSYLADASKTLYWQSIEYRRKMLNF